MRINRGGPLLSTINGFGSMTTTGFVGLCNGPTLWSLGATTPFTRLHLHDGSGLDAQQFGYRPWQRNGISLTGNRDQAYIGQKFSYNDPADHLSGELLDYSDLVLQWSDNPGTWMSDRMRFIFTSEYTGAATGNSSLEGLEAMQLFPAENGTEVFVGIGDWYGQLVLLGSAQNPDERFDIADRTMRLRSFSTASAVSYQGTIAMDRVLVADPTDGRVYWRPWPTGGGGTTCEWRMNTVSPNHVWTAEGAADPSCPDAFENVGIGIVPPAVGPGTEIKVRILENTPSGQNDDVGLQTELYSGPVNGAAMRAFARSIATTDVLTAYDGKAIDASVENTGGYFYGQLLTVNSTLNRGVHAKAETYTNVTENVAVLGEGLVLGGGSATENYGARFLAQGGTNLSVGARARGDDWAFYGDGSSLASGGTWTPSDAMFKTNVQPLTNGLSRILQLQPTTYDMNLADYGFMGFNTGSQIGLIADSAASIVPELVRSVYRPADVDSAGNVINPAITYTAMNYDGYIPLLIGAIQEQNTTITQLQSQVVIMQAQLTACCTTLPTDGSGMIAPPGHGSGSTAITEVKNAKDQLKIQPNPFPDRTTISYTLATAGQVRLIVSTTSGKQLRVLEEATRAAGTYTYEWNTDGLAAGMYHVMLLVDGAPVVQKAVKIAR